MTDHNCLTCGLPVYEHSQEMAANCAVFNISASPQPDAGTAPDAAPSLPPSAPASGASTQYEAVPYATDAPPTKPGPDLRPRGRRPVPSISVASVLLGWCNDIKRELEEFATDGPVGPMVPYRADEHTSREQLAALEKGLGDLIRTLFDLRADVGAAKDAVRA